MITSKRDAVSFFMRDRVEWARECVRDRIDAGTLRRNGGRRSVGGKEGGKGGEDDSLASLSSRTDQRSTLEGEDNVWLSSWRKAEGGRDFRRLLSCKLTLHTTLHRLNKVIDSNDGLIDVEGREVGR